MLIDLLQNFEKKSSLRCYRQYFRGFSGVVGKHFPGVITTPCNCLLQPFLILPRRKSSCSCRADPTSSPTPEWSPVVMLLYSCYFDNVNFYGEIPTYGHYPRLRSPCGPDQPGADNLPLSRRQIKMFFPAMYFQLVKSLAIKIVQGLISKPNQFFGSWALYLGEAGYNTKFFLG